MKLELRTKLDPENHLVNPCRMHLGRQGVVKGRSLILPKNQSSAWLQTRGEISCSFTFKTCWLIHANAYQKTTVLQPKGVHSGATVPSASPLSNHPSEPFTIKGPVSPSLVSRTVISRPDSSVPSNFSTAISACSGWAKVTKA